MMAFHGTALACADLPGIAKLTKFGPKAFCVALVQAVGIPKSEYYLGFRRIWFAANQMAFLERLRMMPGQPIPQDIVDALVVHMIRRRWQIAGWTVISVVRAGKLLQGIRYRYALRRAARLRLSIERTWLARARRIRAHKRAIVIQRFARGRKARAR